MSISENMHVHDVFTSCPLRRKVSLKVIEKVEFSNCDFCDSFHDNEQVVNTSILIYYSSNNVKNRPIFST